MFNHTVIDSFVMPADNDEMWFARKFASPFVDQTDRPAGDISTTLDA